MDFRAFLTGEFERRRQRNPRYSLRSFASNLGVHNATLSRLMHRNHRLTTSMAAKIGKKLGLTKAQIAQAIEHERAEAILQLASHPDFRADSRWLATMSGCPIDEVNIALHRLLHSGRLTMTGANRWSSTEG